MTVELNEENIPSSFLCGTHIRVICKYILDISKDKKKLKNCYVFNC